MEEGDVRGVERLVGAVQALARARGVAEVRALVSTAARSLTGADGASLVVLEGGACFHADEDAIEPLWRGQRFPVDACVSGWVTTHRRAAVIEDVYADARVAADRYRSTFVKSLAMVPIRSEDPIGAIGAYWARRHSPTDAELHVLGTLAESAAIALANASHVEELEARVRHRTTELEAANAELDALAYAISHDLRAPLRAIQGFSAAAIEDAGDRLDDTSRRHLGRVVAASGRMNELIDALLALSRVGQSVVTRSRVDLGALAREIEAELRALEPERDTRFVIADGLGVEADPRLVRELLTNLLGNAWKFTRKKRGATIELGVTDEDATRTFVVRDDGVGFDEAFAGKLFTPFQRLHSADEFPGTGLGLATVRRIARLHHGEARAEGKKGGGATFRFTLG